MAHDHPPPSSDATAGDRRVLWAVAANLGLTVVQIGAGVLSGSLAMIADAIHNLSDAMALVIALAARRIARRPADADMTFGYGRAEVVGAFVNLTVLVVLALYLAWEGAVRLVDPPEVTGWIVVVVAGVALAVDAVTAALVFAMSRDSVNIRAAFLHNVMDALGSVAVMASGALILLYDWWWIDPAVTLAIAAYILWHAGRALWPVTRILMLAGPARPSAEEALAAMEAVAGVAEVHSLQLWMMGEHDSSLEAHVLLEDAANPVAVKAALKGVIGGLGITRSVLELETEAERCTTAPRIGPQAATHGHA